ncbi:PP2C family serine/threonine-protein phosphatase [Campylobacter sp. US33a]|uniref:PP2C family serine/threonine-protein phosphatase n=1 Tax=Campylobacter sp. US33a TaxID=2498120 RepID=UPI001FBBC4A3|nr:PP2C family serine/threonine-protein phosphatase [Campylobacter sp. US33a]
MMFNGFGISVKGKNKILNQDYCLLRHFKNACLMVVCDGLGSKKFSHIGAKYLAKSLTTILRKKQFDFDDLVNSESILLNLWQKYINKQGLNIKDCSTTLLCAIISEKYAYFGRVGDGMIVVFADTTYILEDNGEFSNVTTPFGSQKMKWLQLDSSNIKAIGLCSDGISEIIDSQHTKTFFSEYISEYKRMDSHTRRTEIRAWLNNFNNKGFCDDKSIVVAWRM